MRIRLIVAAFSTLMAANVYAQSADVTGQWTLTAPMVMCTDMPITAKPNPRIVVAGPHTTDGRTAMTGGLVVINRFPADGLEIGQRFVAQRIRVDKQMFSKTNEDFADLRVAGIVTVRAIDENNALASIDFACDSIETGDMLEPYVEVPLPTAAAAPIKPDFTDRSRLLFGTDNRIMFGTGDVFSIERGSAQGVTPGARYAIYRDFHNNLPLVYVADVVVMTVNEQTSKVVVTQAVDSIEPGDIAVPRTRVQ
ncbi:MAG TPA: hypothetical protein VM096_05195 [Vicinamibacterales bacterium]|nr:hypothetical protein [Vicinamibacterales bacterium]